MSESANQFIYGKSEQTSSDKKNSSQLIEKTMEEINQKKRVLETKQQSNVIQKTSSRKGKKKFLKIDYTPCYCPQCCSDIKISTQPAQYDPNLQSLYNQMQELPDIEQVKTDIKTLDAKQKKERIQILIAKIEMIEGEIIKTRNDIINVIKLMALSKYSQDDFITDQNDQILF